MDVVEYVCDCQPHIRRVIIMQLAAAGLRIMADPLMHSCTRLSRNAVSSSGRADNEKIGNEKAKLNGISRIEFQPKNLFPIMSTSIMSLLVYVYQKRFAVTLTLYKQIYNLRIRHIIIRSPLIEEKTFFFLSLHFLVQFYSVSFSTQNQNLMDKKRKKKDKGLIFVTWRNIWPASWVFYSHCSGNKNIYTRKRRGKKKIF